MNAPTPETLPKHGNEMGDTCNRDGCEGVLDLGPVEGCSCHISPPCGACVSNPLICPTCGWEDEE